MTASPLDPAMEAALNEGELTDDPKDNIVKMLCGTTVTCRISHP